MTRPANLLTGPHPLEGVQVIRPQADVSAHVYRDGKHVVLKLNRDRLLLSDREAVLLADDLVDAAETKETK